MTLQMKTSCEGCNAQLFQDGEAYVCSFECTYCNRCMANANGVCSRCGGELSRRPRRMTASEGNSMVETDRHRLGRWWVILVMSFVVWTIVAFVAAVAVVQLYRAQGNHMDFQVALGMEFSQMLSYAPLTPFVFILAARHPIRRTNFFRQSLVYLLGGLVFTAGHLAMRAATPYGVWDRKAGAWHSALWNYHAHTFDIQWPLLKQMFVSNVFDDVTGAYIPIILAAYVVFYYSRLKDREMLTANLEAQLTKANLRALKSQLQPHFLFNTMHSISGLMFTDVKAADKMMTRLSELLRMSLDDATGQMTTLSRELEFVSGYLEIEKMRFGDRLEVVVDIPAETLDAQVPHLLLQPFVENAIQHGIGKLSGKGEITISSRQESDNLFLTIKDSGRGFCVVDGSPLKPGLGIRASQERLQTLFGQNQAIRFESGLKGGATVTIRVPFRPTAGQV